MPGRRSVRWVLLAVVVLVAAVILVVLIGPVSWWLTQEDGRRLGAGELSNLKDTRALVLQAAAGLVLLGGLIVTTRTYLLTREGQITTRFGQAIELLGAADADVRVGAIYALERVAVDSPKDAPTIVETLQTFVQTHSPAPDPSAITGPTRQRPGPDVVAAARVLTRTARRSAVQLAQVDLSYARLPRAWCAGADLSRSVLTFAELGGACAAGVDLSWARLGFAKLDGADLESANLIQADLADVSLVRARLRSAMLHQATLRRAVAIGADLGMCDLFSADLRNANLTGADLRGAILVSADLSGADLTGTDLRGVDLTDARLDRTVADAAALRTLPSVSSAQLAGIVAPHPVDLIGRRRPS